MLFAKGRVRVATTSIDLTIGVGGGCVLLATVRRKALFDTRVLPRSSPLLPPERVLYLLLEGTLIWHATGEVLPAPCFFVASCDSAQSDDRAEYRTEGETLRGLELHFRGAAPVRSPAPLDPSDPLVVRGDAYHRASFGLDPEDTRAERARAWVAAASEQGLAPGADLGEAPGPIAVRLWQAVAAALERFDVGSTMSMVALGTGVSERQARRDVQEAVEHLGLPYAGWRDAAKRFRLRLALVLLSGPEVTIAEVARAVGYRRAEALANAFADAGLPPPTRVRRALLADRDALVDVLNS